MGKVKEDTELIRETLADQRERAAISGIATHRRIDGTETTVDIAPVTPTSPAYKPTPLSPQTD
jgi:hypothetical protein